MSTSMSSNAAADGNGNNSAASAYGSQSEGSKSPLSMSLGFLKNLTEKKSTRVDGQTPKRRGPKPDSKPALTRRQELNRQAQRTHRERKELYIKALEVEVLRLKETYSMVAQSKEALAEENRALKHLLSQHGIAWTGSGGVDELRGPASNDYTSSGSISGSYAPGSSSYSPHPHEVQSGSSPTNNEMMGQALNRRQVQTGVDYDQVGIDFVLTLERPCMDHMQYLVERSSETDGDPCGHALMASCPPEPFPDARIPFGHSPAYTSDTEPRTWDVSKPDLRNLLDLSKRLNLDGEITPVMAWGMVLANPRFSELRPEHFKSLCQELGGKVRCYGFGAVLEEFEVRDALESVFYATSETHY